MKKLRDEGKKNRKLDMGEVTNVQYLSASGKIQGITKLETGEQYGWYVGGSFKTKEDVLNFYDTYGYYSEQSCRPANVEAVESYRKNFGDRIYLMPQISGLQLFESLWPAFGLSRFIYHCRKNPDLIHHLINDRKEAQLKMIDGIKTLRPEVVFGGDDFGQKGRPLISPLLFKKFFKPAYAEIFEKIHEELGAQVFNHCCGNMMELLPDYIEAGLDGWQSLEPASQIDHAALKKKYGDTFLFVGGLDSREISFGTRESLTKHCRDQIHATGKNGGYIAGPTHHFLTKTPLDNVIIMREALAEESRTYYK